jgi:hypothetical protein
MVGLPRLTGHTEIERKGKSIVNAGRSSFVVGGSAAIARFENYARAFCAYTWRLSCHNSTEVASSLPVKIWRATSIASTSFWRKTGLAPQIEPSDR